MKISKERLKQIIKEELEAVIGEEATAESGDQIKQQAKRELAQYYNNYINTEAPASGPDRMNFVRDWLSGWEDGKREWTSWWPLYNAWRTQPGFGIQGGDSRTLKGGTISESVKDVEYSKSWMTKNQILLKKKYNENN